MRGGAASGSGTCSGSSHSSPRLLRRRSPAAHGAGEGGGSSYWLRAHRSRCGPVLCCSRAGAQEPAVVGLVCHRSRHATPTAYARVCVAVSISSATSGGGGGGSGGSGSSANHTAQLRHRTALRARHDPAAILAPARLPFSGRGTMRHALFPGREFLPALESHPVRLLVPVAFTALFVYVLLRMLSVLATWRSRARALQYLPWDEAQKGLYDAELLVVDCTHPSAPTLTHHKGHNNPHGLKAADSSTGIVINAIKAQGLLGGEAAAYCQRRYVTTNHFDIDSFLSVWCYLNRDLAKQYAPVLRHMARIGDFREALLSPELVAQHGAVDGVTNVRDAFTALKLCCWINSLERRLFSAPYEAKDCVEKFSYFLPIFASVLADPEGAWDVWSEEYKAVVGGFDALTGPNCSVELHRPIGLAVLRSPNPMHYYALFSQTCGCDYVLTMYSGGRYELECKYTQFVQVHSRPVMPRFDLTALATALNSMESEDVKKAGLYWVAPRFTDTGPVLRLEDPVKRLSKAQRYGHPDARPFAFSSLSPDVVAAVTVSFLEFGMQGLRLRRSGFAWEDLHRINQDIAWNSWLNAVLDEHETGGLLAAPAAKDEQSRRLSRDALQMSASHALPPMSERSHILSDTAVRLLSGSALPGHLAFGTWSLVYCTARDGYSLHNLYRRAAGLHSTLLVVQDMSGHVFGCFAAEPWKIHPRFYGTGETSVFQVHPRPLMWRWNRIQGMQNDYFQFSTHEGLGVGGCGHFAVWLDNDLCEGSSNPCDTFASPTLSATPEFRVTALEVWHIA
uniref:Oxidation resistance protein 1 n=1 Tax=Chlamydomonas euryale TaxID=1486919 RepID=A0A7R9YSI3_9CHLO|mmetsp:Transcript_17179/g.51601  ORF Transcript_17179/g.51601 Transcript_17179/m.51601 type:complete len:791 (+) Transcript_17179:148-2520(+)